ncbi:hypothetical protein [Caballeronia sp. AZ10_KS36]|uniref:hypothetical protein n=1 Tax=Caballeronia sp. AZ10_KS36 TaxID=2921757 RepID=UPI0020283E7F|nr:hypothetical protein [Caballeronia sp. AZ10_KS36]
MDLQKIRGDLEDAIAEALGYYDFPAPAGMTADCAILAVTLMGKVWEEFEPSLIDASLTLWPELQPKVADAAGDESKDVVTREQIVDWARSAGMNDMLSEGRIAMLADFAIFARAAASAPSTAALQRIRERGEEHQRFRNWQNAFIKETGHPPEVVDAWQAARAALNAPAASSAEPKAAFDDPRVQTVYELICDGTEAPQGEHWDGFISRRIVDALFPATASAIDTLGQVHKVDPIDLTQPTPTAEDHDYREGLTEALGLPTNGTRDGKKVGFAWDYLISLVRDLADAGSWRASPAAPSSDETVAHWIKELRRAHVYLDEGKPFFSGKDCAELADIIEGFASVLSSDARDAARYRALKAFAHHSYNQKVESIGRGASLRKEHFITVHAGSWEELDSHIDAAIAAQEKAAKEPK